MGKKLYVHEKDKVQVVFKMEDGRTGIVDGKILCKRKNSFIVKAFKKVVLSLSGTGYDLVEMTSSTIKILRKSIQNINPISHEFNLATDGIDDGEY